MPNAHLVLGTVISDVHKLQGGCPCQVDPNARSELMTGDWL